MKLPAGIDASCLLSTGIPVEPFEAAKNLYEEEDHSGSLEMLEAAFSQKLVSLSSRTVSLLDGLVLYAWNLVSLKDSEQIKEFFEPFDNNGIQLPPQLEVTRIWGEFHGANYESVLNQCDSFIRDHSDPIDPLVADYLFLRAYTKNRCGESCQAIDDAEVAFSIHRLVENNRGAGWVANFVGILNLQRADFIEALKWFRRSLIRFKNLPMKMSMIDLNVGITYYKIGDYRKALKHLQSSLRFAARSGWTYRQCFANIALGNVHRLTRDCETARKHLHRAYNQAQELQFPREEALALEFLGDVYRDEGDTIQARRFYKRALAIGERIAPKGDIVMEAHRRIGECYGLEKRPVEALPHLNLALDMSREQGDRYEEAVTLRILADVSRGVGDLVAARGYVDQSVEILSEIDARHEAAISLLASAELGLLEMDNGRSGRSPLSQLNEIWRQATRAMELFIRVDVTWWTEKCRAFVSRIANLRTAQERADKDGAVGRAGAEASGYNPGNVIIHSSAAMRDLIELCDLFATSDEPVLITGETGTGKEVIAQRIHQHSKRHDGNLVVVNVAAIPQTMFEREFFGHVKGAFSGADRDSEGFAARASGGTLFLDEIGDLPLDAQPKLLRLLQEGAYQAIGDPGERQADIRLVAATNANLKQLVSDGRFRSDLYYRLKILDLDLPPVRRRREDVLPLLRHFLCTVADRHVDLTEYFNRASLALAEQYDWPGNVREIAMIARRAHLDLTSRGKVSVTLATDSDEPVVLTGPHAVPPMVPEPVLTASEGAERSRILLALEENGGSRLYAAKELGIGRSTLYRRMERLGIPTRRS